MSYVSLVFAAGRDAPRAKVGNPSLVRFWVRTAEKALAAFKERWPSGLRRTPAKRVYLKRVPRVQIPLSPPFSCNQLAGP